MAADRCGYYIFLQPEGGPNEVQVLPAHLFTEGNLCCRDPANSIVKTEMFIDLPREGQNLS